MDMTIKRVSQMTLANFGLHMRARTDKFEYERDRITQILSTITGIQTDDLENMDLSEYSKLEKEYINLGDEQYQELLDMEAIKTYSDNSGSYEVPFENDEIFLKMSEKKFIEKLLSNGGESESERANLMYENMHYIAAIIFRNNNEDWKSKKFNPADIEEKANRFKSEMNIKYLFPYNKILFEKTFKNR